MKVALDTNILLRIIVGDDPSQQKLALETVKQAALVAIPTHALCEFVWVLTRSYKRGSAEAALAIRALLGMPNALADSAAVIAGLDVLEAGGDFADGVIAHEGRRIGGPTFLTFDSNAAALLQSIGHEAHLLTV